MISRAEEMAARIRRQVADEVPDEVPDEPVTPPAKRRTARPAPPADEWAGARPRVRPSRTPLNVGMPNVLRIHERLALLTATERITAQDAVAEAVDQWLTAKGYPR